MYRRALSPARSARDRLIDEVGRVTPQSLCAPRNWRESWRAVSLKARKPWFAGLSC
jgi:hypothetical protein